MLSRVARASATATTRALGGQLDDAAYFKNVIDFNNDDQVQRVERLQHQIHEDRRGVQPQAVE